MAISLFAGLWFGWRVETDLDLLAEKQLEFAGEKELNRELTATYDRLLSRESIVKKAAVLGLFPPSTEQLRKP